MRSTSDCWRTVTVVIISDRKNIYEFSRHQGPTLHVLQQSYSRVMHRADCTVVWGRRGCTGIPIRSPGTGATSGALPVGLARKFRWRDFLIPYSGTRLSQSDSWESQIGYRVLQCRADMRSEVIENGVMPAKRLPHLPHAAIGIVVPKASSSLQE